MTNSLDVGGVETNLVGLTERLRARGHDVWVASSGGTLVSELAGRGVRHVALPISLHRPAVLVATAFRLARLLRRERFDVVHAMSAAGNLATLLGPRGGRTAFVTSPMGLQQSDHEARWVTDLRNRMLAWRADRVAIISEEIGAAVRRLGVRPERLTEVAVVGIDLERFAAPPEAGAAVRRELGIAAGAAVVATIGALHSRKRHDLFVDAAARVRDAGREIRFLVVGEGPEHASLQDRIDARGQSERITLTGQRHDIGAVLAATDVYVKPGIVEGFIGITVMEAMAARRPVVAFATRDVEAAVTDGETGLLVPLGDDAALASAVERLLRDPALATALAERGHAQVVERFSIDNVAARLESFYRGLARNDAA